MYLADDSHSHFLARDESETGDCRHLGREISRRQTFDYIFSLLLSLRIFSHLVAFFATMRHYQASIENAFTEG